MSRAESPPAACSPEGLSQMLPLPMDRRRGQMNEIIRGAVIAVALLSLSAGSVHAATWTVLGKTSQIKNPSTDASKRKVSGQALERGSHDGLVGDPTVNGATLEVIANGGTPSDQTFALPKEGWSKIGTVGFQYSNRSSPGAVKKAKIKLTPSGIFQIRVLVLGKGGPVSLVPPNPGSDGGFILTLTMGDSYCVAFGGVAGGSALKNDGKLWSVRRPTGEACPAPAATTTTTTTLPHFRLSVTDVGSGVVTAAATARKTTRPRPWSPCRPWRARGTPSGAGAARAAAPAAAW